MRVETIIESLNVVDKYKDKILYLTDELDKIYHNDEYKTAMNRLRVAANRREIAFAPSIKNRFEFPDSILDNGEWKKLQDMS